MSYLHNIFGNYLNNDAICQIEEYIESRVYQENQSFESQFNSLIDELNYYRNRTTEEKLDAINIKEIELYLRNKKLNKINKDA